MKLQTVNKWFNAHHWRQMMNDDDGFFMFFCFQSYTCWCTMSFSSCLCGRTGKPSSPSPWTPWRRWVCLTATQRHCRLGWWDVVGSADVGYSLPPWSNAAFRLIILSSGSARSCAVMALNLTTALQLCRVNTTRMHTSWRGHPCISLWTAPKHTCRL